METDRLEHLKFIQSVATRMNTNSFQLKGWTVTVVTAILAFCAATKTADYALLGVFPVVVFWLLDSFYLHEERKFRALFYDVAGLSGSPSMIPLFSMTTTQYDQGECCYWRAFRSRTVWTLYLPLIIFLGALVAYDRLK